MKNYFDSEQAVARLIHAVGRWQGTPWMPNSEQVGIGVACHNLPRAVYIEVGALPQSFPRIVGDPTRTRHSTESAMTPFLDARPEFVRLDLSKDKLMAGDLVGLQVYRCVDHLAVMLSSCAFAHVLVHKKTAVDRIDVPPWSQHIGAAWRIKA